jgi:hypothetical protein
MLSTIPLLLIPKVVDGMQVKAPNQRSYKNYTLYTSHRLHGYKYKMDTTQD